MPAASYNEAQFPLGEAITIPEDKLVLPIPPEVKSHQKLATAAAMAASLLLASVMLSWVALFNGAPLVFADTISYSTAAFQGEVPGMFSIFYSFFILPLHRGVTFWPVVFVQGAILAHLLYLTARTVMGTSIGMWDMLLIITGLAVFSSLPWVSGEILPDIFAPVVLLGFFLLAFEDGALSRAELFYVGGLTTFAITTHLSYVPIAAGLILLCIGLQLFLPRRAHLVRWVARLVSPLVFALTAMFGVNLLSLHQFVLARNSNVFLLAKWIDEGPALSYLKESCPSAGYALCTHVEELEGKTQDELKWAGNSPFKKVGTFDELEPEAREIVRGTLYTYPGEILRQAIINAALQLARFQAGDGLTQEFARWVGEHVGRVYGTEAGRPFIEGKQANGELPITLFRSLHLVGLVVGAGVSLCVLLIRRNAPPQFSLLCAFVFFGIVWNACVTGALSAPYDRYLARVIWLVLFLGLLGLFQLAGRQPMPFSAPER